ncbi:glycosyltransferase [Salinivibrio kushneri]|uniref:glycosyltransferase n=1 Tax=Salinivibrio kushneri TaxID=1908198 RepID=UPI0009884E87|nr:glycosyltransferase [Salinivibrio kushneri]OOE48856.1 hypothetical protein BZG12_16380 [Salinivibrio kushneri]
MKKLTIVISTANKRIVNLRLKPANSNVCYVIVHQVYDNACLNEYRPNYISRDDVKYIRLDYPGLSKSRNVGLEAVDTEYAYIMDDDVDFNLDKMERLVDFMSGNQVDVGTCQYEYEDGYMSGKYKGYAFRHNFLSAAKVASIEICLKVKAIREKSIQFDEDFGLGTQLPSGEEYIFMVDAIKSGLNVWFYPLITGVHPNITSGTDFYSTSNKILAKREMLKRTFGVNAPFLIVAFWIKKMPVTLKKGYFLKFTKKMLLGK